MMFPDGFENAFLGIGTQFNTQLDVYSTNKIILILENEHGMTNEEAIEFFEFNIQGAWLGKLTPVFLNTINDG